MTKFLRLKALLLISVLLVCLFGVVNGFTVGAEMLTDTPQDSAAVLTDETKNDNELVDAEEETASTEKLEIHKDNSLNKMGYSETVLIILLSVLIVAELSGTVVLIVLILKKSKRS